MESAFGNDAHKSARRGDQGLDCVVGFGCSTRPRLHRETASCPAQGRTNGGAQLLFPPPEPQTRADYYVPNYVTDFMKVPQVA